MRLEISFAMESETDARIVVQKSSSNNPIFQQEMVIGSKKSTHKKRTKNEMPIQINADDLSETQLMLLHRMEQEFKAWPHRTRYGKLFILGNNGIPRHALPPRSLALSGVLPACGPTWRDARATVRSLGQHSKIFRWQEYDVLKKSPYFPAF